MKRFETIRVLGDGGFGTVYECRDKESGDRVAIKKIKQRFAAFDECLQLKEVKSLRKIKHTNVVKLLQIFRESETLYLVFELMGETLLKTINRYSQRGQSFTVEEVRSIMEQIFTGLAYIHKQGFFHRDMKPDNIMWGENGVIKISDFGLAREIRSRPPYTEYVSTRWYRAPEIVLRSPYYNSPVDIWAAGAIMAELFMGKAIFPGLSETDQMFKIINVLGTPNMQQWPDAAKLANKLNLRFPQVVATSLETLMPNAPASAIALMNDIFKYDPARRPSAAQILQHPFFTGGVTDLRASCGLGTGVTRPPEPERTEVKQENRAWQPRAPIQAQRSPYDKIIDGIAAQAPSPQFTVAPPAAPPPQARKNVIEDDMMDRQIGNEIDAILAGLL